MFKIPKNTPRWIIFSIDIGICALSLGIAYLLRFDFVNQGATNFEEEWKQLKFAIPVFIAIRAATFYFAKTYKGIIRYTSTQDTKRLFITIIIGSLIFALISPIRFYFVDGFYFLPRPIIILDFLITLFLMLASRFVVKLVYLETKKVGKEKKNVVVFGAGELGMMVKSTLKRDSRNQYEVLAFVDDFKGIQGKRLEGIPVIGQDKLQNLIDKEKINQLIIGIINPKEENKKKIIDIGLKNNIETLSVPPVESWINGELSSSQIKKVKIEDLLGRKEIELSTDKIDADVFNKAILITGAAGSIGSEIVKQLLRFRPEKLILLDQAESALYDLSNEYQLKKSKIEIDLIVADISSHHRMENVFSTHTPEMIYHAAAYKHVPLMEDNPSEAINTNVLGTRILADLADKYNCDKFVMVSTDKAVNPTNVMGASKRIAEIYCQSLNEKSDTKFITTRFGNVLGSNGSVIPLFKKQIEAGGPLTVTHKDITRFFMTIPEACQLVLEAGTMGVGGEIFVFDMGESVKIIDLARKMIQLSGFKVGKEIEIKITGLRPGEKLFEELLNNEENSLPTHHPQIMIGKVRTYDFAETAIKVSQLCDEFKSQDNIQIVKYMKEVVPEYISQNSIYTSLDK